MREIKLLGTLVLVCALCACGLSKKDLGLARQAPDETKVVTNKPLILPPEYNVRPYVSEESLNSYE